MSQSFPDIPSSLRKEFSAQSRNYLWECGLHVRRPRAVIYRLIFVLLRQWEFPSWCIYNTRGSVNLWQLLLTGNFAGRTFCQTQFARKRIYTHCSLARRFPKLRPRGPCTLVLAFGNACPPKLWWGAVTTHERSVPNSGQGRGHPHLVVRPNRMVKGKLFRRPVFCVLPCKVLSHKSVRR